MNTFLHQKLINTDYLLRFGEIWKLILNSLINIYHLLNYDNLEKIYQKIQILCE
jgi:hypothetical protein